MRIDNGCYQRYQWFYNPSRWFFKHEVREYKFWEQIDPEGQSFGVYHRQGYVLVNKFRKREEAFKFMVQLEALGGYFINKPKWFNDKLRFPLEDKRYIV